jgi:hypothetical protein
MDEMAEGSKRSVTVRAVVVGLLLVAAVCLFASYAEYMAHWYRMGVGHIPMAVLIPFSLLVFVVNRLCGRIKAGAALESNELVVVFVMGLMGSMMVVSPMVDSQGEREGGVFSAGAM